MSRFPCEYQQTMVSTMVSKCKRISSKVRPTKQGPRTGEIGMFKERLYRVPPAAAFAQVQMTPFKLWHPYCDGQNPFRTTQDTMGNHTVCWYLQGESSFQGLLRWCEMDFVHPQYLVSLHEKQISGHGQPPNDRCLQSHSLLPNLQSRLGV